MRSKFKEFYKPTEEEINDAWEHAFFSFDANVLLNLYRYTEQTRTEIIETLQFLSENDRLWVSYQAAFEYQKNRLIVIDSLKKAYDNLKKNLSDRKTEIEADLKSYKRHPYLKADEFNTQLNETFSSIENELDGLKEDHPDFLIEDPIFESLTEILEDCIGDSLTNEELEIIYKEGKIRYEKKVPPGYMDKKEKENNGDQSLYGDLIIWKELLRRFKDNDDKIIFVTDDLKEDWWYMFNGKTISPRQELLKEFIKITGKEILIYKPEQFLQFAKSKLHRDVDDKTLEEVEEVRNFDEKQVTIFDGNLGSVVPYWTVDEFGNYKLNPSIYGIDEKWLQTTSPFYPTNHNSYFSNPQNLAQGAPIYGNINPNPQFVNISGRTIPVFATLKDGSKELFTGSFVDTSKPIKKSEEPINKQDKKDSDEKDSG